MKKKNRLNDVFLYNYSKEQMKYRKTLSTEELSKKLSLITPIYLIDKEWVERQMKRIVKYLIDSYSNRKLLELHHTVKFTINKDDKYYKEASLVKFLYDIILVAPLVEAGLDKLDETYFPFSLGKFKDLYDSDAEWKQVEVNRIINDYCSDMYLYKHRDLFTRESASEAIYFVRCCGDYIAHQVDMVLMQNLSLVDFIDLMNKEPKAEEIINIKYDLPEKITHPKQVERLAKEKIDEFINVVNKYPGSMLHTIAKFSSKGQFKEVAALMGNKPDLYGSTIPITSMTNNIKGFVDPVSVYVDASGGLKAEVIKLKVADAGTFERSLITLLEDLKEVDLEYICDSPQYVKYEVDSIKSLKLIDGRYYLLDEHDEKEPFKIIDFRKDKHLLGKTIYLKTPMTCTHPRASEGIICRGCYTESLALVTENIHVGLNSAYTSSDNTQQISLSAKHNLITSSHDIMFSDEFDEFFIVDGTNTYFRNDVFNSIMKDENYANYSLIFYVASIEATKKNKSKIRNKFIPEIIIGIDTVDGSTKEIIISNKSLSRIFMSDELEDLYKGFLNNTTDDFVKIPFRKILMSFKDVDEVKFNNFPLFYVDYKNDDLSDPVKKIASLLGTDSMKEFSSGNDKPNGEKGYQRALETVVPLFKAAGIDIEMIHLENILSRLMFPIQGDRIDWYAPHPHYNMMGYRAAIKNSPSAVASMVYEKLPEHLSGKTGIYERSGKSIFDQLIK